MSLSLAQIFALISEREALTALATDAAQLYAKHRGTLDRVAAILGAEVATVRATILPKATQDEVKAAVNLALSDFARAQAQREERDGGS